MAREKPKKLTKEEKFMKNSFDKMFEISGNDFSYEKAEQWEESIEKGLVEDIDENQWYNLFTWSEPQKERFEKWFINEYCKRFSKPKKKGEESGEKVCEWFIANNGLKIL